MDNPLSPAFFIGQIHIGQIEGASCFNMGNNWPTNFRNFRKQNQGFGTVRGNHNSVTGARSLLNDPDTIDSPNFTGKEPPAWLTQILNQGDVSTNLEEGMKDETDDPDLSQGEADDLDSTEQDVAVADVDSDGLDVDVSGPGAHLSNDAQSANRPNPSDAERPTSTPHPLDTEENAD